MRSDGVFGIGFARAKITGIYIYIYYAPPSATIAQYEETFGMLVSDARSGNLKVLVGCGLVRIINIRSLILL